MRLPQLSSLGSPSTKTKIEITFSALKTMGHLAHILRLDIDLPPGHAVYLIPETSSIYIGTASLESAFSSYAVCIVGFGSSSFRNGTAILPLEEKVIELSGGAWTKVLVQKYHTDPAAEGSAVVEERPNYPAHNSENNNVKFR